MKASCSYLVCEELGITTAKGGPWLLCAVHTVLAAECTAQALTASRAAQGTPGKTVRPIAPCPSYTAQQRHKRQRQTCEICSGVITVKARVANCGTMAGYRKHLRDQTPQCLPCLEAMKATSAQQVRKARKPSPRISPQVLPQAPGKFDDARTFFRPRGTHCSHCPSACRDYHLWECSACRIAATPAVA